MRVGYLGPEGTFSHEALMDSPDVASFALTPLPTIYDAVMAVHEATVDRALVPMETSVEGAVNVTLDTLAGEAEDVHIVGEAVHRVRLCLVARDAVPLEAIETVASHPQAHAQCAGFLRAELPSARVLAMSSTADAVRSAAEGSRGAAALGNRLSADLYGCTILRAGVEDLADNETRFVWLARDAPPSDAPGPWKTSLVFWGPGAEAPGWLVRCLSELAFRGVNLTRIESRPRKQGLGRYMFFVDLEGRSTDPAVAEAVAGLGAQVEHLRVLGSYPAA